MTEQGAYDCSIRGGLKNKLYVGDMVIIDVECRTVDRVLPRKNQLYRPVVANVDYALIVMSAKEPTPSYLLLDRMLVSAEYEDIEPIICINKIELADVDLNRYSGSGYRIIKVSSYTKQGLDELEELLTDKITVLAGPSGVGKSSITSLLIGEELRVGEVSSAANRGKHTTRHSEFFELPSGGMVVDSPGFGAMDLSYIQREELKELFPEFDDFSNCKFNDCLHVGEIGCVVAPAAESGLFPKERYESYLKLMNEVSTGSRY